MRTAAFGTGMWAAIKSRRLTLIFIALYILKILSVKMRVKTFLQRKFEKWNISFLLILNLYTAINFHVSNIWNEIVTSMTSNFNTNICFFFCIIFFNSIYWSKSVLLKSFLIFSDNSKDSLIKKEKFTENFIFIKSFINVLLFHGNNNNLNMKWSRCNMINVILCWRNFQSFFRFVKILFENKR